MATASNATNVSFWASAVGHLWRKRKPTFHYHRKVLKTMVMNDQKEDVYAALGHLFYSIAASDGNVAPAEAAKLKALVKAEWMPLEPSRDAVGTDLAYYIEIGFDHAHSSELGPEQAFDRFSTAFHDAPAAFDASTRHMVLRTAKAVANAFAGKSKAEQKVIDRLEKLFA